MKPLEKAFWDEMAEMLHIKEMSLKALHRMNAVVTRPELKKVLDAYRLDSQKQGEKLREMFQAAEMFAREKKCDGMMGVLLKGQQIMQRSGAGPMLDAALLSLCRKITAYNVASQTTLVSWAKLAKAEPETVTTLKELLRIETQADQRFLKMTSECDAEAADQEVEPTRRAPAPPRKPAKELAETARWGAW